MRYLAAFLFQMSLLIMAASATAQALSPSPAPTDQTPKNRPFQNLQNFQRYRWDKLNEPGSCSECKVEKIDYCAFYHFPGCPEKV